MRLLSKPYKTILIGLTSLFLMTSLSACVTTRPLGIPTELLEDCPETPIPVQVNGDLIRKVRSLRVDLKNCNADKKALRDWASKVKP